MDLWTWINAIGNVADSTVQGRTWLTRAINGSKNIYNVKTLMVPNPAWISETNILLSNRLKAVGNVYAFVTTPVNYSIAPFGVNGLLPVLPTLKQQCSYVAFDFMFGTGAPASSTAVNLSNALVTSGTLPAIDYRIL